MRRDVPDRDRGRGPGDGAGPAVDRRRDRRGTAGPGEVSEETWQRFDSSPDLSAWALITAPVHPSLREAHPDTATWGELRVDPGLAGLDSGRARPLRVEIGCREHGTLWRVPVEGITPDALAWHPRLPLVAGLAVRGGYAFPWVADHRARTVVVHDRVRAATSLTALGGGGRSPLVWSGSGLVVLTPAPPPPSPARTGEETDRTAVACEANGPGWLVFPQGVPELSALAAVRVAELRPDGGALRVLTGPLLVRGLEPAPGGGQLLVTHLDEEVSHSQELHWAASVTATGPTGPGTGARPVPPGSRWATGAPDVLAWPDEADGRRRILTRHAAGRAGGAAPGIPVPPVSGPADEWWPLRYDGALWVLGVHDDRPYLAGPRRTVALPAPAGLRLGPPVPAVGPPAGFLLDCRDAGGRYGIGVLDPRRPGLALTWAADRDLPSVRLLRACSGRSGQGLVVEGATRLRRLRLSDGALISEPVATRHAARAAGKPSVVDLRRAGDRLPMRLTLAAAATTTAATTTDAAAADAASEEESAKETEQESGKGRTAPAPLLLWLRAQDPGGGGEAVRCAGAGPVAHLDLVPRWPADATAGFLHTQITDAVRAALDALDEHRPGILGRGVVVGGHSFGASLALYALAHDRRLDGAIVHSGCYNRTLTPGGFQYERRSYWQTPEVYHAFSALLFAHRLDRPVLIVHGVRDTNPATAPEQAVGLYRGIVAAGGRARLLLLPGEGHNFRYAESHRTLAREHGRWLDRCARTPERA
ncbi:S9 family peptidase [Streptomyces beigongshangae]|uniref:S9 family peptidase n=1 Tax=Streptomyces beigongshangae TaxID=2841597 RepID=UPI001C84D8D4|nr:prolyl oligopeptidase family serine peptidase [Streptomyces sp. REN17]